MTPPSTSSSFSSLISISTIITASCVPATTRSMTVGRVLGLLERWIEDVPAIDEADPGRADRTHEGRAGKGQGGGGGDHGDDVGIVLEIVRQDGDDHLGLVLEALDEQRPDRPVDQAGDQRLLLRGAALALEEAAGILPAAKVFSW